MWEGILDIKKEPTPYIMVYSYQIATWSKPFPFQMPFQIKPLLQTEKVHPLTSGIAHDHSQKE